MRAVSGWETQQKQTFVNRTANTSRTSWCEFNSIIQHFVLLCYYTCRICKYEVNVHSVVMFPTHVHSPHKQKQLTTVGLPTKKGYWKFDGRSAHQLTTALFKFRMLITVLTRDQKIWYNPRSNSVFHHEPFRAMRSSSAIRGYSLITETFTKVQHPPTTPSPSSPATITDEITASLGSSHRYASSRSFIAEALIAK